MLDFLSSNFFFFLNFPSFVLLVLSKYPLPYVANQDYMPGLSE
jgi:hypothetical protein